MQKEAMHDVHEWRNGMSFVRDWNDGESYAVVGLAIGGDQQVIVGGIRNGISAGIWVLNGPGKIGADGMYLR